MKARTICWIIGLSLVAATAKAQPDSLWSRSYGGENEDYCHSFLQTADGGFVMAGWTASFGAGGYDLWLVRTNDEGDSLWSRTFGGEGRDWCLSVIQTADGGLALAGVTFSFGVGGGDFWLVRTDEDGDTLWSRTFGGEAHDECNSVIQTADGGFALAGYTESFGAGYADVWLVRTDENGDFLWSRTFGGGRADNCHSVIQTADGGFILAGRTESFGAGLSDFWLVRTDNNGGFLWSRTFGGEGWEECNSVIQTADGGFTLAGDTPSFGAGLDDFWLVRTDEDGDSLWSRTFGGDSLDGCHQLIPTAGRGFALTGYSQSFGAGLDDFWLLRSDENGARVWSKSFGGGNDDWCSSIIQTADGGFALAGVTGSFGAGDDDFWLVKTGPDTLSAPASGFILHPSSFILFPPFPNPFNSTVRIGFALPQTSQARLALYDLSGRQVALLADAAYAAGYHSLVYAAYALPSGLYIVCGEFGGMTQMAKVTLLK